MPLEFLSGKRVLVTGARGFLGANLVGMLGRVDCRITRVMRRQEPSPALGRARVVDLIGDVREGATWRHALEGVDVVFHLAAQTSAAVADADPRADFDANVVPILHLIEACRRDGLHPVVLFAGTVTEAGVPERMPVDESFPDRPLSAYDEHKLAAERHLKRAAHEGLVKGATLRLANVYGPGPESAAAERGVVNRMIRRALAGEALSLHGSGDFTRDYLYVEDAARAFLAAGARIDAVNGAHWVIGSGAGHTLAECFEMVASRVALKTGRRVAVRRGEPGATLSPLEMRSFVANSSRFIERTGWRSTCALPEGIDRTIEALSCAS